MKQTTKEYDLNVTLSTKDWNKKVDVFSDSYRIALRDTFVEATNNPKEQSFKNHVESFVKLLKLNCIQLTARSFKKRQIYVVRFGMNTWSEINGDRPAIIYKASHNTLGDDVTVIPLTSARTQKKSDANDVFVAKNETNNLYQDSFARCRQLRVVSKLKVGKSVGVITDKELIKAIDATMDNMFGIDRSLPVVWIDE